VKLIENNLFTDFLMDGKASRTNDIKNEEVKLIAV